MECRLVLRLQYLPARFFTIRSTTLGMPSPLCRLLPSVSTRAGFLQPCNSRPAAPDPVLAAPLAAARAPARCFAHPLRWHPCWPPPPQTRSPIARSPLAWSPPPHSRVGALTSAARTLAPAFAASPCAVAGCSCHPFGCLKVQLKLHDCSFDRNRLHSASQALALRASDRLSPALVLLRGCLTSAGPLAHRPFVLRVSSSCRTLHQPRSPADLSG